MRKFNTADVPVGEKGVVAYNTSAGEIYTMALLEFCAEPVGEPTIEPGIKLLFKKREN